MAQAFPVLLVIRNSEGEVRWMEVRDWQMALRLCVKDNIFHFLVAARIDTGFEASRGKLHAAAPEKIAGMLGAPRRRCSESQQRRRYALPTYSRLRGSKIPPNRGSTTPQASSTCSTIRIWK